MPVQTSWAAWLIRSRHTCFSCQEHRRELWSNCCVQVPLKQPERAGAHLQLDELGKASDTGLMVPCLLPEAQHGATAMFRLHQASFESVARCNCLSAAFAQEKIAVVKYFNLQKNEYRITVSPETATYKPVERTCFFFFFQENVQNPQHKDSSSPFIPRHKVAADTMVKPESSASSLAQVWFQHLATKVPQSAINKSAKYHFATIMAAVKATVHVLTHKQSFLKKGAGSKNGW